MTVGPTPKNRFWEEIVLPSIPGLVPGTYLMPTLTVNESGLITAVTASGASLPVVYTIADLPTITGLFAGMAAVVLDAGNGKPAIYTYSTTPSPNWIRTSSATSVNGLTTNFAYNSVFPLTVAQGISTTRWKKISITITTPFTAGTTFTVLDSNGGTWMNSSLINPQAVATYEADLSGNNTAAGAGTDLLLAPTGVPVVGAGTIYVEFV
jgi:hypothetical protein